MSFKFFNMDTDVSLGILFGQKKSKNAFFHSKTHLAIVVG